VFNAFEVDLVRRASSSKGSDEDEMANVAVVSRGVAPDARCVLILAHGNALDLGTAAPFALEMHDALDVGVVAFDYTGYGPNVRGDASGWAGSDDGDVDATEKRARASAAKWKPSIEAAKADLIAVVDWVVTARRVRPERVVVVGQSVGSGPAVAYAAAAAGEKKRQKGSGAFYLTLVPIRPRWRGGRRSLRTSPGASLRPPLAFNTRPRRLSTPTDAYELHPDRRALPTSSHRRVGPREPVAVGAARHRAVRGLVRAAPGVRAVRRVSKRSPRERGARPDDGSRRV
jgi:hypothetical protein